MDEQIVAISKMDEQIDLFQGQDVWYYEPPIVIENSNHVVLFELPLKDHEIPKAKVGTLGDDAHHVMLPSYETKKTKRRWELIKESLLKKFRTSEDLEDSIKAYNAEYKRTWNFVSLHKFFEKHDHNNEYFSEVLPKLISLALQLPQLIQCPIPLLIRDSNMSISMSQQQAACLMANAFLCTFPQRDTNKKSSEFANYGNINFDGLFCTREPIAIEKLKCIFNYFKRVLLSEAPKNVITFQKRSKTRENIKWESLTKKLSSIKFEVTSEGKIEDGNGMLQVDFSNRFVGGGVLKNGCAQEEIRFLMSPEMIIAKLLNECLDQQEALLMIGCEQFNSYRGYSSAFKWDRDFLDQTPLDSSRRRKCRVVAIDALKYNNDSVQFLPVTIKRELRKAYVGFFSEDEHDKSPIASGLWGCGAFNGYPIRSALIQLIVSSENQRNLKIFTFGNDQVKDEIIDIFNFLIDNNYSLGELYQILIKYKKNGDFIDDPKQLVPFIKIQVLPGNIDTDAIDNQPMEVDEKSCT